MCKKYNNTWLLKIMEALPENRLEELDVTQDSVDHSDEIAIENTIIRHSRSLREITVNLVVPSTALGVILRECEALELLNTGRSAIGLSDAIASPWASSRLKYLRLNLYISVSFSVPDTQYTPYYLRAPPAQPSEDDHRIFAQFDTFYRQIGKQKDMIHLYVHWMNPISHLSPHSYFKAIVNPLSGMLVLEKKDNAGSQPGFLQLLGGLTKLKQLGGHIYPETPNQKIADDALEVDWIAEHWPLLDYHDFLPSSGPEGAMDEEDDD
jgi:hypothetical protein